MGRIGRIALSLLYSLIALVLAYVLSFYLSLLLDSNYHDGYGFIAAIVIAIGAAIATFRWSIRRLGTDTYLQ
ncbi:TctA family transporter [Granulicella aggregans]|uniref:TctA family transporter n=1 Tax=Granulicella aggregans TaxID=474949 RepID=A0A7W7ZFV8_9BACT|nr:TctA family transporter [Granulicella aggregans]